MTIESTDISHELRRFLPRSLGVELEHEDDIFHVGGATSLFAMELVMYIEKEFEVVLTDADLDRKNLATIDAMTRLIEHKQTG